MDLSAKNSPGTTECLNVIGVFSPFHESFGYYADPVDERTSTLPKGWKSGLVHLHPGDTEGVSGLCLDPHDLAIAKYVARREKDVTFTRELARRGLVDRERLLELLENTVIDGDFRVPIRGYIERDFRDQQ